MFHGCEHELVVTKAANSLWLQNLQLPTVKGWTGPPITLEKRQDVYYSIFGREEELQAALWMGLSR